MSVNNVVSNTSDRGNEERMLELLALARRSRIKWVTEGADLPKFIANSSTNSRDTRDRFPVADCVQSVLEILSDIIDDGETIDVDSVISLIPPENDLEEQQNAPIPQYDGAEGAKNPYHVFIEKLRHSTAIDIVKSMQKFVSKFEQSMREFELQLSEISDVRPTNDEDKLPANTIQSIWSFIEHTFSLMKTNILWSSETESQLEKTKQSCEKFLFVKLHNMIFANDVQDSHLDKKLFDRIESLSFLTGEHLDIRYMHGRQSSSILQTPIQILRKLMDAKCPADKLAVLKKTSLAIAVILKELKPEGAAPGADEFLPMMILTIKECNPAKLNSTVKYLQRFTHPSKLQSEAGYLLTHFVSAVNFLENVDAQALTISPEEFERAMLASITRAKANHEALLARQKKLYANSKAIALHQLRGSESSIVLDSNSRSFDLIYDEADIRWKYYGPPAIKQDSNSIPGFVETVQSGIDAAGSPSKGIKIGITGVVGIDKLLPTAIHTQNHSDPEIKDVSKGDSSDSLQPYESIFDELIGKELELTNGTDKSDIATGDIHYETGIKPRNHPVRLETSRLSSSAKRSITTAAARYSSLEYNSSDADRVTDAFSSFSGRFMDSSADNITLGDITTLLSEYKVLLKACLTLTGEHVERS